MIRPGESYDNNNEEAMGLQCHRTLHRIHRGIIYLLSPRLRTSARIQQAERCHLYRMRKKILAGRHFDICLNQHHVQLPATTFEWAVFRRVSMGASAAD
jgi:hypothetical protein